MSNAKNHKSIRTMKTIRQHLLLCVILLILLIQAAHSKEVINHFHSDIVIDKSGQITVTETIEVNAENNLIKRGIYRDFPTEYFGKWWTKKEVLFEVTNVTRNNQTEPFHTAPLNNGIRVYIGSGSANLPPGIHEYKLTYKTDKQLGYFEDYDEFYWNVTGNGWQFDILKASTTIQLPENGQNQISEQVLDQKAWTGYYGEQNQDFIITNTAGLLGFETTKTLQKNQGLTIGLQVPKGIFVETEFDLADFLSNNLAWVLALLLIFSYLGFYLSAWLRYGRDPEKGVIVARFYPPKNLSPAAVHYIENEGSNDKTLTTGLLSLAVKGHISITQLKNQYQLKKLKTGKMDPLSKGETVIKDKLFKGKHPKLTLNKSPNATLLAAKNALNKTLKTEFQKKCFIDNSAYMIWGWVLSVLCFFTVTFLIFSASMDTLSLIGMMITNTILLTLATAWAIAVPLFAAIFVAVFIFMSYTDILNFMITHQVWLLFTLFLLCLNLLFCYLLRSPTPFGRHIKDQIDGLKLYMKTAEENRLDLLNPPDKTIAYYEQLLPYAVALGLENQWAEKFSEIINTEVSTQGKSGSKGYQPVWYQNTSSSGRSYQFSAASVSHSLRRSVSASATTPIASSSSSYSSSSSSSSSGGSSGGGGGGGGGGGW